MKPGMKMMVKLTPLVKDNTDTSTDVSEDSVDIQDVRSRLGVWPIVEAAVGRDHLVLRHVKEARKYTSDDILKLQVLLAIRRT